MTTFHRYRGFGLNWEYKRTWWSPEPPQKHAPSKKLHSIVVKSRWSKVQPAKLQWVAHASFASLLNGPWFQPIILTTYIISHHLLFFLVTYGFVLKWLIRQTRNFSGENWWSTMFNHGIWRFQSLDLHLVFSFPVSLHLRVPSCPSVVVAVINLKGLLCMQCAVSKPRGSSLGPLRIWEALNSWKKHSDVQNPKCHLFIYFITALLIGIHVS